jgi:presenilin-like A22 family membrane protease
MKRKITDRKKILAWIIISLVACSLFALFCWGVSVQINQLSGITVADWLTAIALVCGLITIGGLIIWALNWAGKQLSK